MPGDGFRAAGELVQADKVDETLSVLPRAQLGGRCALPRRGEWLGGSRDSVLLKVRMLWLLVVVVHKHLCSFMRHGSDDILLLCKVFAAKFLCSKMGLGYPGCGTLFVPCGFPIDFLLE